MGVTHRAAVVSDSRFRDHVAPPGHPEAPERLTAVEAALAPHRSALQPLAPRPAEDAELRRIHTAALIGEIRRAAEAAPSHLDPDTYVSPRSEEVARLAAGASIDLARAVARGEVAGGFAAIRPPGHHAEPDRAMGFCLFNNAALAAAALRAEEGLERVAIVDWDVHHGNGTQHAFESDPSVLYVSTHQFPFYPGTGAAAEAGRGEGRHTTVNIPMPAGCGDPEYVGVFTRVVAPVLRWYRPELLLVSAGFDAHRADPLGGMELTAEGYRALAGVVRGLADELCHGRLLFLLEGGYSAAGLEDGTAACIEALLGTFRAPHRAAPEAPPGSTLSALIGAVRAVHGAVIPHLGDA